MDYFINFTEESKRIYAEFMAYSMNADIDLTDIKAVEDYCREVSGDTSIEVLYSDEFLLVVQSVDSGITVNNYIRFHANGYKDKTREALFDLSWSEEAN